MSKPKFTTALIASAISLGAFETPVVVVVVNVIVFDTSVALPGIDCFKVQAKLPLPTSVAVIACEVILVLAFAAIARFKTRNVAVSGELSYLLSSNALV